MTLPIYPGPEFIKGLAYTSKWSPSFLTQSLTTATGAAIDQLIAQYPLHDFELSYQFLRDGGGWGGALQALEFRTMMGFFLQMGGQVGRFAYHNPDDHMVFQQPIGIGDGATTSFTLIRTFGANGYGASEPVGQVDTSQQVNVYLGGASVPVVPGSYAVNTAYPGANTIQFANPPAAGAAIAADFAYFYYCKLAANSNSFEKFMNRLWSLGKVTLHSCRAGA